MKNYLYLIFVAALFVTSCTKEEQTENLVKAPSIVASQENNPNTKTLLAVNEGVGTIYWQPAEDINVFFGTTSVKYTSTNTENVTTAAFETSTIIGSSEGSSTNIWGLYPFSSEAVCNGSKVTTTIPSAQYGVPETFDKNVFTTLAHSTTKELQFLNVCGGIKFSLSRADITKITFEGNNGETLAGKVDLTFVDDVPAATSVTAATKIILTPKTGSTFAKDVNYYIITLPVSMIGGFTMTFETATQIGTFNYTAKAVTVSRSKFSKKENIDTYANFIDIPKQASDLSSGGTSNCYLITEEGRYKFKADVKGNSSIPLDGDPYSAEVLWETKGNGIAPQTGEIVSDVYLADGYVFFTSHNIGNALIAVRDSNRDILWSWHIWITSKDVLSADITLPNNAGIIMDRNLGAMSGSRSEYNPFSLLYQYGRKDPFLGGYRYYSNSSSSLEMAQAVSTGNWEIIAGQDGYSYSDKHPMQFLSSWANSDFDEIKWTQEKNMYDPCPPGYKIPDRFLYTDIFETYYLGESSHRSVGTKGTICSWYEGPNYTGYKSVWFPYTRHLNSDGVLNNILYHWYDDGALWTYANAFLHSVYYGSIRTNYNPSPSTGNAVRCGREDNPILIMPENLSIDKDSVVIEPFGETTITVSIMPDNATLKKFGWDSEVRNNFSIEETDSNVFRLIDKKGTIRKYISGVYSPLAVYASNDEYRTNWSSPVAKRCTLYVCPSEPKTGDGGWFISAKAGDTFCFHLNVGDHEDGDNGYSIYVGNQKVKYDYGDSNYHIDFAYTFLNTFQGWLYIDVDWGLYVNDITTTATVIGRYNKDHGDASLCDSWKNGTPIYKFKYEKGVLIMD